MVYLCLIKDLLFLHEWSHVMITRGTHTYIKETISPFILPYKVGITWAKTFAAWKHGLWADIFKEHTAANA
jgi:hypothetical protein